MKKKLLLMTALLLTAALLSSCAYLPYIGIDPTAGTAGTAMTAETSDTTGDTVTISREEYERYKKLDSVLEVMDIVNAEYYEDVDETTMIRGAMSGVLSSTGDYYTFYYSPEEYEELWEDDEGEYAGIGIQISSSYVTGISKVSRVFEGSPAQAADVHRGDILYKVEDMYVTAYNIEDAVDIMRGTPGTSVHVVFLRGEEQVEMDITRANVTVNRVDAMMLEDGVGYIYLYDFAGDCAAEFTTAANTLVEQGARGIIIDLRDNGGGWVRDADTIADLFTDYGVLCYLEYKNGERYYYYTTDGKLDVALVVLVNENSASSSEILTGCLKDRADATVVGVNTYGKGIVQSVVDLGENGGMQLTIAQYYTPNGNAVHKIGIAPDVEIALPEDDNGEYEFGDLNDPQLAKALEVMREKLAQ